MDESSLTKFCTKCKLEKPLNEFNKSCYKKDGLQSWCKICDRLYYQKHKNEILAQKKQYYQENKEEKKAKANQCYWNNREEKKAYARQHHKNNREKDNLYSKQYHEDNKEKSRIWSKQYYIDNKEEKKAYAKQYRQDNKAYISVWMKQYSQTPNGKAADKKKKHRRRAQKIGADYENFNPNNIFERDGYRCQLCGRKTRPDYNRFHPLFPNLDHIIPLNKGGSHTKKNTQCLCRLCNMIKHDTGIGDQLRLFG